DRVLVFRIDDEVGEMVEARGSQTNEILVPFSGRVRHAGDVIAREVPLADDALDVREVPARQSGRWDLDAVERRHGMPRGEGDLPAMSERCSQGGRALV